MKLLLFSNATVDIALLANYKESIKNAKGRIRVCKDGEKSEGVQQDVCRTGGDQR